MYKIYKMYIILEILADSEYSGGGFKFCAIYNELYEAIKLLQEDQFCTFIEVGKTISNYIGQGMNVNDFTGGTKITFDGEFKVNDPQIVHAREFELQHYKIHEFKYYFKYDDDIYTASHILLKNYNHDNHTYHDHVILLDNEYHSA